MWGYAGKDRQWADPGRACNMQVTEPLIASLFHIFALSLNFFRAREQPFSMCICYCVQECQATAAVTTHISQKINNNKFLNEAGEEK